MQLDGKAEAQIDFLKKERFHAYAENLSFFLTSLLIHGIFEIERFHGGLNYENIVCLYGEYVPESDGRGVSKT